MLNWCHFLQAAMCFYSMFLSFNITDTNCVTYKTTSFVFFLFLILCFVIQYNRTNFFFNQKFFFFVFLSFRRMLCPSVLWLFYSVVLKFHKKQELILFILFFLSFSIVELNHFNQNVSPFLCFFYSAECCHSF